LKKARVRHGSSPKRAFAALFSISGAPVPSDLPLSPFWRNDSEAMARQRQRYIHAYTGIEEPEENALAGVDFNLISFDLF
jgi:hypothetical protein